MGTGVDVEVPCGALAPAASMKPPGVVLGTGVKLENGRVAVTPDSADDTVHCVQPVDVTGAGLPAYAVATPLSKPGSASTWTGIATGDGVGFG